LEGLALQSLAPAETIVVRRAGDVATEALLGRTAHPNLVEVVVNEPGVLAAMRAGVRASRGDVIAFIDDDAVPRPDWLSRLVRHFDDPAVGAAGGRDYIERPDCPNVATVDVGRVTRWGKLIGNHHRGTGEPRNVMVLKAVGMAFRRHALTLPSGLRGAGAQPHFEVATSLSAFRRGWKLIYDPTAVVDHHIGQRFDADQRGRPAPQAVRDAAYNLVTALLAEAPELFWRRALYGLMVGDRATPGFVRAAVALIRRERNVLKDLRPSLEGQIEALWRGYCRSTKRSLRSSARVSNSGRPRVALLAHDIHGEGGMERACLELIRRACEEVDFVVISSRLDPSVRSSVRWRRVPIPRRPFPFKFCVYYLLAGLRLARERVDLVQTVGAIVPNKVDVASIHFCHAAFEALETGESGSASLPHQVNTRISHWLALIAERWSYRPDRVRMFAAVSDGVAREMNTFYPGVHTVVTVNGVDHDRFKPDPAAYARTRAELGVGADTCVALFVGGDWDRKGLAFAIEGLVYARARAAPVVLWVVGPGDRPRFVALAAELGVSENVRFFGHRADPESLYKAADVCVIPTLYETFCIAAFEGAAAGLPLIVTPVHGANDLVGPDVAGIRVERSGDSVGAALVRLALDPDLRLSMGTAGQRRCRSFTWRRSVEAVTSAYQGVLSTKPVRPDCD
jgi:glycosyltransferase involved in cell wall biosynthesis